jgi:ubiquinone/menaquinone biosynthesis C-methylase UbiE
MTAMDVGSGMGFFTIPMSVIVGDEGNVIAVDLQPEMIAGLQKRAEKKERYNITTHVCDVSSLKVQQWNGAVDFALIFWMLHEVPDAERLITEIHAVLTGNGRILFVEPALHVDKNKFERSLEMIKNNGFALIDEPKVSISRAAVLQKI